ncbi:DUF6907 domain-containing protein [Nonomuraea sp. NPDC050022]|uniref:DUF6907 domain-containing protein n=1 Tax=Nonomuraea sp. NPDC050022 TaxID=3364358 RepID=UPI0037B8F15A
MSNHITTTYDPATLNAAQLDGLACVTCGSDDQPMKPVDVRDGVQVFECAEHSMPYWQTEPCPAWCRDVHKGSDEESDRLHTSPWQITPVTTMDMENFGHGSGLPSWVAHTAEVSLQQGYREVEPRVLMHDAANDRYHLYLTLDETKQLANAMLAHVAAARGRAHRTGLTQVYDDDGRCPDLACLACYPIPAQRVAETA